MSKFKMWISQQPIQKKLIYSNIFGTIFALLPIIFVMLTYEYFSLRNTTLERVWVQAEIIGESSSAALAFHDNDAAKETLLALRGAKDLIEAHLILPDGTILESYYAKTAPKTNLSTLDLSSTPKENITGMRITIKKPIYLRSEFVGSLLLSTSLDIFYKRLIWYAIIIITITTVGFFFAWWIAIYISKAITEPLRTLTAAAQQVVKDSDYTMSLPSLKNNNDELGTLSNTFSEMMSQIQKRDLSLRQVAYYDQVTGIANRHYFEEHITQAIHNAEKYSTSCYLLMIDLDDFKIVNDTLGHNIGDELLRYVSKNIQNTMRQNDSIFRIGGDEFAIVVESKSEHESMDNIAQKIIKVVSTPVILNGHEVKVGASIGISSFPKFSKDVYSLMSTADSAMYVAKKRGKNNYKYYDTSLLSIDV